jgi:kynureninase
MSARMRRRELDAIIAAAGNALGIRAHQEQVRRTEHARIANGPINQVCTFSRGERPWFASMATLLAMVAELTVDTRTETGG